MTSNFDAVWKELEAGVERTFQNNREHVVEETATDWLHMYTTVLSYCTARAPTPESVNTVPVIRGKDIYENLKKYLVNYIEQTNLSRQVAIDSAEAAEKYLNTFMSEWKIYYSSIQKLNRIFGYIVKKSIHTFSLFTLFTFLNM